MRFALLTLLIAFVIDLLTLPCKSSLDIDRELLAMLQQLRLLQCHQARRLRGSRFEKLVLAVLAFKLKPVLKRTGRPFEQCLLLS